jgi:hypothetical protein
VEEPHRSDRSRQRGLLVALVAGLAVVAIGIAALGTRKSTPSAPEAGGSRATTITPSAPAASPLPATPAECVSGWTVARDGGDATDLEHRLVAVSGSSPTDVWAVGSRFPDEDSGESPLAEHWDGRAWTASPLPGHSQIGELTDVVTLSPHTAWAVGSRGRILRWDGTSWAIVPSPRLPANGRRFDAVVAVSARNVWALGSTVHNATGESTRRDVFEHWNGRRWKIVPSPQFDPRVGTAGMQDLAANRRGDVWAVGGKVIGFGEAGRVAGSRVERLAGGHWALTSPPEGTTPVTLAAVTPSNDVWAVPGPSLGTVGSYGIGGLKRVVRWSDGTWHTTRWLSHRRVATGIAADSRHVWLVGQSAGFRAQRLFLLSWSGGRWRNVPLGPAGDMRHASQFEFRSPAVTITRDGGVVVLDTEGTPRTGQRNFLWTRCAPA